MAAVLSVVFFCNRFLTAIHERHHMADEPAEAIGVADQEGSISDKAPAGSC